MSEAYSQAIEAAPRSLWYEGPNYTADAVIINPTLYRILLIKRSDTGEWALPGGFINKDEPPLTAAKREAQEETGAEISTEGVLVYQGVVEDPRTTATAWIETAAYLFTVDTQYEVKGSDDAVAASWVNLERLPALYGSHKQIIETALLYVTK